MQLRNGHAEQAGDPLGRISPRRRQNAERLLHYLAFNGGKVFLDKARYSDLRTSHGIDRTAVDQAVDDLWAVRLISVVMIGELQLLMLQSRDDHGGEEVPAPPVTPRTPPRFVLARGGRGGGR